MEDVMHFVKIEIFFVKHVMIILENVCNVKEIIHFKMDNV